MQHARRSVNEMYVESLERIFGETRADAAERDFCKNVWARVVQMSSTYTGPKWDPYEWKSLLSDVGGEVPGDVG